VTQSFPSLARAQTPPGCWVLAPRGFSAAEVMLMMRLLEERRVQLTLGGGLNQDCLHGGHQGLGVSNANTKLECCWA